MSTSETGVYCHSCAATYPNSQHAAVLNSDGERVCPFCRGEFIEMVEATAQPPATPTQAHDIPGIPQLSIGTTLHQHFTAPTPNGNVDIHIHRAILPLGSGTDLAGLLGPTAMSFPGGQAFMMPLSLDLGAGGMGGIPLQLGDFAMGDNFDQLLTQLMNAYQPPARPTSQQVRDSLPRLPVKPADTAAPATAGTGPGAEQSRGEESAASAADAATGYASCRAGEPCTVCHESFVAGETVVELPCQHCYHEDCAMPWLNDHNTCPVCRHELPASSSTTTNNSHNNTSNISFSTTAPAAGQGIGMTGRVTDWQRLGRFGNRPDSGAATGAAASQSGASAGADAQQRAASAQRENDSSGQSPGGFWGTTLQRGFLGSSRGAGRAGSSSQQQQGTSEGGAAGHARTAPSEASGVSSAGHQAQGQLSMYHSGQHGTAAAANTAAQELEMLTSHLEQMVNSLHTALGRSASLPQLVDSLTALNSPRHPSMSGGLDAAAAANPPSEDGPPAPVALQLVLPPLTLQSLSRGQSGAGGPGDEPAAAGAAGAGANASSPGGPAYQVRRLSLGDDAASSANVRCSDGYEPASEGGGQQGVAGLAAAATAAEPAPAPAATTSAKASSAGADAQQAAQQLAERLGTSLNLSSVPPHEATRDAGTPAAARPQAAPSQQQQQAQSSRVGPGHDRNPVLPTRSHDAGRRAAEPGPDRHTQASTAAAHSTGPAAGATAARTAGGARVARVRRPSPSSGRRAVPTAGTAAAGTASRTSAGPRSPGSRDVGSRATRSSSLGHQAEGGDALDRAPAAAAAGAGAPAMSPLGAVTGVMVTPVRWLLGGVAGMLRRAGSGGRQSGNGGAGGDSATDARQS